MPSQRLLVGAILLCAISSLITLSLVRTFEPRSSLPGPIGLIAAVTATPTPATQTPTPAGLTATPAPTPLADVEVTVDRSQLTGYSHMDVGVTHTQYTPDPWNNPASVARAKNLLRTAVGYQNQHIYGWGTTNPEPKPGHYNFSSLDERVKLMRSIGGKLVITLCCAPDWMTKLNADTSVYPNYAPTPKHYRDFANLAARIARRYPDVHYFQVWNELKGFWDPNTQNYNYVAYTRLYNDVYDALKTVNPAIKVGGPYVIIQGSGTDQGDWTQEAPIIDRNMQIITYWLQHMHGADFICLDRAAKADKDPLAYPPAQMLQFPSLYESIADQIHAITPLPIWWSEERFTGGGWNYQTAGLASILLHALEGGSAVALQWQPQGVSSSRHDGNDQSLFSDTRVPGGGTPFPYYFAFKDFHRYFGPGTPLYLATSSSPDVEVLASRSHILLINKRPTRITVRVNGLLVNMNRYAVEVISG